MNAQEPHYPRNRLEPEILRDRLLDALETIICLDTHGAFREMAKLRFEQIAKGYDA